MEPLDGNAAGGDLAEVFVPDMTMAVTTCATCGAVRRLAELMAYMKAPGVVLRCRSCGAVMLRLVFGERRAWLDLQGCEVVELMMPAAVT